MYSFQSLGFIVILYFYIIYLAIDAVMQSMLHATYGNNINGQVVYMNTDRLHFLVVFYRTKTNIFTTIHIEDKIITSGVQKLDKNHKEAFFVLKKELQIVKSFRSGLRYLNLSETNEFI